MRIVRIDKKLGLIVSGVAICCMSLTGCASMNRGATFRSQTPQNFPTPAPQPDPGPGGSSPNYESAPGDVPMMGPELGSPGARRDPYGRPTKSRSTRRPPVAATRPGIINGPGSGYVELPPPRD